MRLTWLGVPGGAEAWAALAFWMDGDRFVVGAVAVEGGRGAAWGFDGPLGDIGPLGVETLCVPPPAHVAPVHPNRIDRIDHVVYAVPDLDAAIVAIRDALGLDPRRRARPRPGGAEMAFYRAGEAVLEVVGAGAGPALWGVAFGSPDLDASVAAVRSAGGPIGDPKPAVQGGRIATVPTGHAGWRLAVMEAP